MTRMSGNSETGKEKLTLNKANGKQRALLFAAGASGKGFAG